MFRIHAIAVLFLLLPGLMSSQELGTKMDKSAKGFTSDNPFAKPSSLLYQAPPFDRIHDSDYQPALEEGMRQQLAEVEALAKDWAPPTFENTIVALERSGALLTRVSKVFSAMTQANTNDALQKV